MAQTLSVYNPGNYRTKISNLLKSGLDVLFTAYIITGKQKTKIVERAPLSQLSLITKNLKFECPDKVRIELFNGKDAVNPLDVDEYRVLKDTPEEKVEPNVFRGFGEAEINQIVDERFRERQRLAEYEQLKEKVLELSEENEELRDTIMEMENHTAKVEGELESKRQIRYYAGMLGDILESFGIAKDKVKRPLAELMGMDETSDDRKLPGKAEDASGIAEFTGQEVQTPEARKRMEIISLVAEYLKTTPNEVLAAIFSIFSEVEQDNSLAMELIDFINTRKTDKNAKV